MNMQTENIEALAAALAKAQGKIEAAKKDVENTFFKSQYADLASVWQACRAPLSENGLSIIQQPRSFDGQLRLVTRLLHSTGQWIEDDGFPLLLGKNDMQGLGSAVTYARRYGLMAAVGIAPEDDDGNAAVGGGSTQPVAAKSAAKGLHGPRNITTLKNEMRAFAHDLAGVSDLDELTALLNSSKDLLEQCARDLPEWVYGDDHQPGANKRIEYRRKELATAPMEIQDGEYGPPIDA